MPKTYISKAQSTSILKHKWSGALAKEAGLAQGARSAKNYLISARAAGRVATQRKLAEMGANPSGAGGRRLDPFSILKELQYDADGLPLSRETLGQINIPDPEFFSDRPTCAQPQTINSDNAQQPNGGTPDGVPQPSAPPKPIDIPDCGPTSSGICRVKPTGTASSTPPEQLSKEISTNLARHFHPGFSRQGRPHRIYPVSGDTTQDQLQHAISQKGAGLKRMRGGAGSHEQNAEQLVRNGMVPAPKHLDKFTPEQVTKLTKAELDRYVGTLLRHEKRDEDGHGTDRYLDSLRRNHDLMYLPLAQKMNITNTKRELEHAMYELQKERNRRGPYWWLQHGQDLVEKFITEGVPALAWWAQRGGLGYAAWKILGEDLTQHAFNMVTAAFAGHAARALAAGANGPRVPRYQAIRNG